MPKFPKIFKTLLSSFQEPSGKGSGKRISLFVMVAILSFSVLRYTDKENLTTVVSEVGLLIVALAGVSSHYKVGNNAKDDEPEP